MSKKQEKTRIARCRREVAVQYVELQKIHLTHLLIKEDPEKIFCNFPACLETRFEQDYCQKHAELVNKSIS